MKKQSNLVREEWPKIRLVTVRGAQFYQVDARKKGTNGKQETFSTQKEAEERAAQIAKDFSREGIEGLSIDAGLRVDALRANEILKPFSKSLLQAAEHYRDFLNSQLTKDSSLLISELAKKWLADKESGNKADLREHTIKGIKKGYNFLLKHFASIRIMQLTQETIETILNNQKITLRSKHNLKSLVSQFFNWSIEKGYCVKNPCDKINFNLPKNGTIEILTFEKAKEMMRLCETQKEYNGLIIYHALQLFGGLRPYEAMQLKWEDIHEQEGVIYIAKEISKVKDDRSVPIEENLKKWLASWKGSKKGGVIPENNFKNILKKFRFDLGYTVVLHKMEKGQLVKVRKENTVRYVPDCCRHSYASYQIALGNHKGDVAEWLGNSIQIIKKHYKKPASKTEAKAFFAIAPTSKGRKEKAK